MKWVIFISVFILLGCSPTEAKRKVQTFTVGTDKAFAPFIQSAFETEQVSDTSYKGSLFFAPQEALIDTFLEHSTDLIFCGRPLDSLEKAYLASRQKILRSYEVGYDALVVIRHSSSIDTVISLEKLKKEIGEKEGKYVIDQMESLNWQYLRSRLSLSSTTKMAVAGSDEKVLELVAANPGLTGIVSYALVADRDDPTVQQRMKDIRIVYLHASDSIPAKPSPDALAIGSYPFKRTIWMHSTEGVDGNSAGMAGFMLKDKGKRLLLKMGILPATMPGREVELIE
jgi:phosphate transport system substrate-binding protein